MSNARRLMLRAGWLVPVLALPLLSGCAGGGRPMSPEARANAETLAACRERADAAFNTRNRGQIYAPQSQVNTPFSANYQPGVPTRGLSTLFQHDQMVNDCVRNTGAEGSRTPQLPSPTPPQS